MRKDDPAKLLNSTQWRDLAVKARLGNREALDALWGFASAYIHAGLRENGISLNSLPENERQQLARLCRNEVVTRLGKGTFSSARNDLDLGGMIQLAAKAASDKFVRPETGKRPPEATPGETPKRRKQSPKEQRALQCLQILAQEKGIDFLSPESIAVANAIPHDRRTREQRLLVRIAADHITREIFTGRSWEEIAAQAAESAQHPRQEGHRPAREEHGEPRKPPKRRP
ncbi:MAG: hypothetical protein HY394_03930 [Candidatus Diapherotrites archaeon]|nr:hypothetical protein [Candidatus Diapherotrites archaeon]